MQKDFLFHKAKRAFHDLSKEGIFLYQSFVLSILLYGCSVWQPSITYMRKLKKFQSGVFRWIISDLDYVSKLQRLSFLPVCYQKIESDIVLLWKMINKQSEVESEIQNSFSTQGHRLLYCLACLKRRSFALKITFLPGPPDVQMNC